MKKITITLACCLSISLSFSQAPLAMPYLAVARDSIGNVMANQLVSLEINILQGAITGSSVYLENHTDTTDAYGVVHLEIGRGMSADTFSNISWAQGPHFLQVSMDATGGTNYQLMGTTELLSVPYALYANESGNVTYNLPFPVPWDLITPVHIELDSAGQYTVPANMNFHGRISTGGVTSCFPWSNPINCPLIIINNDTTQGWTDHVLLPELTSLTFVPYVTSEFFMLNGYLVPNNIEHPIIINLDTGYVVPPNKKLLVKHRYNNNYNNDCYYIFANGKRFFVYNTYINPLPFMLFDSGTVITKDPNCKHYLLFGVLK
ncbi:MAG: hypothetical protein IH946_11540 [Bacteroidetes bacterium]|nr:hypothetical protein [Bacteroidota bacterium]